MTDEPKTSEQPSGQYTRESRTGELRWSHGVLQERWKVSRYGPSHRHYEAGDAFMGVEWEWRPIPTEDC